MTKFIITLMLLPSLCFASGNRQGPPGPQGWQGSIAGASDFNGQGALGLSIGKVICATCGNRILLHGNALTNGDNGAYGIGASFLWK